MKMTTGYRVFIASEYAQLVERSEEGKSRTWLENEKEEEW